MLSLNKDVSVTPPSVYSGSVKSFIFYFYLVWRGKYVGRVLLNDPGEFGTTARAGANLCFFRSVCVCGPDRPDHLALK